MKTILVLSLVVAALIQSHAQGFGQTNPTASTAAATQSSGGSGFGAGLLSEEGEGDLAAAAAAYRQTIQAFDRQRDEAANAIFRLGEVYRKLGRMEEAKVQYARILREFPDMIRLTEISHKLLFGEEGNRTAGFDWFLGGTHAGTVGIRGGGGVGGGVLGSGGMGVAVGGMPGEGAAPMADADESAGYVDEVMSARYGTTILRRPGTKPQSAESETVATPGGGSPADPSYYERLMFQRYGIVPGRMPAPAQPTGNSAASEGARDEAARIQCINNLKQLGLAARIYATDHEGAFPYTVGVMSNEISVTKVLVCPSDSSHQPAESWDAFDPALHLTYEFPGASGREDEPQRVLFRCPIHGNVALGDGSVQLGRSASSSVTPQVDEILRRRYGLVGELRTTGMPGANASQPATLAIAIKRDGNLTVNGGPMDLAAATKLIQQMPDEMRATTIIELQAEPETDFSSVGAVLDACQEARVVSISLGAETRAAIGQEIERLKDQYKSLRTELSSTQQEAGGLSRQLGDPFKATVDQARARQIQAQERLEALSFPADRLPAVVGQDARYQRLKAEFETAVLDGDKAAQERARARLQEWVVSIYRPELESEAELADRRLAASVAEAQEFVEKQQAMQTQHRELQGKLTAAQERMNQLTSLLSQPRGER